MSARPTTRNAAARADLQHAQVIAATYPVLRGALRREAERQHQEVFTA